MKRKRSIIASEKDSQIIHRMSFVRAQTVAAIADALGAPPLSADAAASLAPHADVRLREVVQDALKAARACKRATLTRQDIDAALAARGEQPLLGWAAARDAARFARAAGHADLFYVDDPEVGFDEVSTVFLSLLLLLSIDGGSSDWPTTTAVVTKKKTLNPPPPLCFSLLRPTSQKNIRSSTSLCLPLRWKSPSSRIGSP